MKGKNGFKKHERHNPDEKNRPTFYMSNKLINAIDAQARQELTSRSRLVSNILSFLLLAPIGQQLQENARRNNRSLTQELEQSLALLQEELTLEQINQFAVESHRSSIQMLTYLILLGLQVYNETEH